MDLKSCRFRIVRFGVMKNVTIRGGKKKNRTFSAILRLNVSRTARARVPLSENDKRLRYDIRTKTIPTIVPNGIYFFFFYCFYRTRIVCLYFH